MFKKKVDRQKNEEEYNPLEAEGVLMHLSDVMCAMCFICRYNHVRQNIFLIDDHTHTHKHTSTVIDSQLIAPVPQPGGKSIHAQAMDNWTCIINMFEMKF